MATLQSEKFDVFCWLKGYFPSDEINKNDIPDVKNFCLMWNLFESKICEKLKDDSPNRFVEKMKCFIKELPSMNYENYNRPLRYFQERYIDEGEVNCKFNDLRIYKDKWKQNDSKETRLSVGETWSP